MEAIGVSVGVGAVTQLQHSGSKLAEAAIGLSGTAACCPPVVEVAGSTRLVEGEGQFRPLLTSFVRTG